MEKELTKFELKLMNILWDKGHAFVNDMIAALPDPKPANSTISTMMRILVNKGFASFEIYGKNHRYYPLVAREAYTRSFMRNVRDNIFGGSAGSMLSFFVQEEWLSEQENEELMGILRRGRE